MVSQTYDGAPVLSGIVNGVIKKVSDEYGNIQYFYCAAHYLNLLLKKSVLLNEEVKEFFNNIENLGTFFQKSSKNKRLLTEFTTKSIPRTVKTRWNYYYRILKTISYIKEEIKKCLHNIHTNDKFKLSSKLKANYFLQFLTKEENLHFLEFFKIIFINSNKIFNLLQKKNISAVSSKKIIEKFQKRDIRNF